jgi:hypothetical protein
MVQAAREVILKAEQHHGPAQAIREKVFTKSRQGKPVMGNGLRLSSSSAQRRSFKTSSGGTKY